MGLMDRFRNFDWGSAAKGAIGGGLAGFAMGGPMGALAGAGAGGLLGGVSGDPAADANKQLDKTRTSFQDEVTGRTLTPSQGSLSSFRGNQQGLVGQLEAMASGKGPSLAALQLQAATDRNVKAQQSMAAGARGPSAALARFTAMQNAAALGDQAAQDAAMARVAEQQMAMQQLGLTLQGARESDEGMSRFNAAQTNQVNMGVMDANDRARLGLLGIHQQQIAGMGPSLGDQLLAGGAQAFQFGSTQAAQGRIANQQAGITLAGLTPEQRAWYLKNKGVV